MSQAPASPNILDLITSTVEEYDATPPPQPEETGKEGAHPADDATITVNLALHALQTAFRYYMLRHQIRLDGPSTPQPSETDSIQAYDQAIRSLKLHISCASELNEEAVIACCLMFAAIEAFHNRYPEVGYHLEAVTRLMRARGEDNEQQEDMQPGGASGTNEGVIQFSDHVLLRLLELSEDYTTCSATELFRHIRSSFTACFGIPISIDL
ncbi:hypothetical protein NW762_010373 [Fusarium torreyae]|uniref:Transcription factor domain-containing protein n=1 Tax=Fusarium torreyae TaxID=1237075 RepID=A0A9W8RUT4_9HYPO|nr:hypothetical protein NW762_010373 [Fusarium torreyae]